MSMSAVKSFYSIKEAFHCPFTDRFRLITLLQLLITLKQLATTSNGTILTFGHPARLTTEMKVFNMFITAVCVLFLIKLRWPKTKSLYILSSFQS